MRAQDTVKYVDVSRAAACSLASIVHIQVLWGTCIQSWWLWMIVGSQAGSPAFPEQHTVVSAQHPSTGCAAVQFEYQQLHHAEPCHEQACEQRPHEGHC